MSRRPSCSRRISDCVPPHIPSHERDGLIFGRGACDAKGVAAAQLVAVERLRREGCRRVGLLFVVGEERGSDGARAAAEWTAARTSCFLVNGEPTGNRLALGTLGILRVRIRAVGRAAHSSFFRTRRLGHREADERARGPARPSAARRSGTGEDHLHGGADRRRRGAETSCPRTPKRKSCSAPSVIPLRLGRCWQHCRTLRSTMLSRCL